MRKLTCHCEQTFSVDLPDSVNLDDNPELITSIEEGNFLSCICPGCNSHINTDLRTELIWPSKNTKLIIIPESERFSFLSGKVSVPDEVQTVIGYPELADRVAVLQNNFDVLTVEALKYHLAKKAQQTNPEATFFIFYDHQTEINDLEFHIHGLRDGHVAVTIIPLQMYESIKQNRLDSPEDELFTALKNGSYVSWQNILIEEDPND